MRELCIQELKMMNSGWSECDYKTPDQGSCKDRKKHRGGAHAKEFSRNGASGTEVGIPSVPTCFHCLNLLGSPGYRSQVMINVARC